MSWREISGISAADEEMMDYAERRKGLRALFAEVEKRIRAELDANETDENKDERTFLWDPIAKICFELAISRVKLSRLSKEFSGLAAHEMADRVRGEKIKENLRPVLKHFCIDFWHDVYHLRLNKLKLMSRLNPARVAMQAGFANFSRFRLACLLFFKKTPRQVMLEMILELRDEIYAEFTSGKREFDEHYREVLQFNGADICEVVGLAGMCAPPHPLDGIDPFGPVPEHLLAAQANGGKGLGVRV